MPEFKPNVSHSQDGDPLVRVDVSRANPMTPGKYVFRLVVIDNEDNESEPAFVDVLIRDRGRPTAILDVVNADGAPASNVIVEGTSFFLSGSRSSDIEPGKIKTYQFTLVEAPV